MMPTVAPTKEDFLLMEVSAMPVSSLRLRRPRISRNVGMSFLQMTGAKASGNRINPVHSYSETKLSVPTQKRAMDRKLFLYVRETVYSLPPLTRSAYSPVLHG